MSSVNDVLDTLVAKFGWSKEAFEIWKEAGFKCAYCDRNLLLSVDAYKLGQTEHILPQTHYPDRKTERMNLTLSCQTCNFLKGRFDPNTVDDSKVVEGGRRLDADSRKQLLARARNFVWQQRTMKSKELTEMVELMQQHGLI